MKATITVQAVPKPNRNVYCRLYKYMQKGGGGGKSSKECGEVSKQKVFVVKHILGKVSYL